MPSAFIIHFFVGSYKTLVVDEVRYPMYFCPEIFGFVGVGLQISVL